MIHADSIFHPHSQASVCVCVCGALGFPMWNHSVHATDRGDREKKRDRDRVPRSGEGLFENRAKSLQPPRSSSCCVVRRINSGARPVRSHRRGERWCQRISAFRPGAKGHHLFWGYGLAPLRPTPLHLLHSGLLFLFLSWHQNPNGRTSELIKALWNPRPRALTLILRLGGDVGAVSSKKCVFYGVLFIRKIQVQPILASTGFWTRSFPYTTRNIKKGIINFRLTLWLLNIYIWFQSSEACPFF